MGKPKDVWGNDVRAMIAAGQLPVVTLAPSARIVQRRGRGRPRVNPEGDRYAHWGMKTGAGYPMRCRAPWCNKPLRKDQKTLTCSPMCEEELLSYCQLTLDVLHGKVPASQYPLYWRTGRTSAPGGSKG